MKEYLLECIQSAATPTDALNQVREYLQARILGTLQRSGAMTVLAFHGGTALRFLYRIPRYSEDLDFTLEAEGPRYRFLDYLDAIESELSGEGYTIELKISDQKTVHSAFIKFINLLFELGLSPHRDEKISIKLDVDTNPPAGVTLETTVVRRHVTLHLQHHDRASLLSGKLHAIIQREYHKGRDLYDLIWYLSDPEWPDPNLVLLNNALAQTGWTGEMPNENTWPETIRHCLEGVRWENAVADVSPFLEANADPGILSREVVMKLLSQR